MDYTALVERLRAHGFACTWCDTREQAADYLEGQIRGETVGFGGSVTCEELGMYERLAKENVVLWHWRDPQALSRAGEVTTYLCSANAVAQTGELVNIDGRGNRLAATLCGPARVYFICGINKVVPTLEAAIDRARNVAAPLNARRLNRKTPCVKTGRCHDCDSPERICNAMAIHMRPLYSAQHTEVVLVGEALGL